MVCLSIMVRAEQMPDPQFLAELVVDFDEALSISNYVSFELSYQVHLVSHGSYQVVVLTMPSMSPMASSICFVPSRSEVVTLMVQIAHSFGQLFLE